MRGFILTPTYRLTNGDPEVHLYGTLESGEPCLVIDDRTRPYFFVRQTDADAVRRLASGPGSIPRTCWCFAGDPVARVTVAARGDVPTLRRKLEERAVTCFEADVRFAYRYLIDRGSAARSSWTGRFTTIPPWAASTATRAPPAHWVRG